MEKKEEAKAFERIGNIYIRKDNKESEKEEEIEEIETDDRSVIINIVVSPQDIKEFFLGLRDDPIFLYEKLYKNLSTLDFMNLLEIADLIYKLRHDVITVMMKDFYEMKGYDVYTEVKVNKLVDTDSKQVFDIYAKKTNTNGKKEILVIECTRSISNSVIQEKLKKYIPILTMIEKKTSITPFYKVINYDEAISKNKNFYEIPSKKKVIDFLEIKYSEMKSNKLIHIVNRSLFGKINVKKSFDFKLETKESFTSEENESLSKYFFRSDEDYNNYMAGNFKFPNLEDERSRKFLSLVTDFFINDPSKYAKEEDRENVTIGTKRNVESFAVAIDKLRKDYETREGRDIDLKRTAILPIYINTDLDLEDKPWRSAIDFFSDIRNVKSTNPEVEDIVKSVVVYFKFLKLTAESKNDKVNELYFFGMESLKRKIGIDVNKKNFKKYEIKENSEKIRKIKEESQKDIVEFERAYSLQVSNRNRIRFANKSFEKFIYKRKNEKTNKKKPYKLDIDVENIDKFEKFLSEIKEQKIEEMAKLMTDLSIDRDNLTKYESEQILSCNREVHEKEKKLMSTNFSSFTYRLSKFFEDLNMMACYKHFTNEKDIVIMPTYNHKALLILLAGNSFAYSKNSRTFYSLTKYDKSYDDGKNSNILEIDGEEFCLNGPLSIDKIHSSHLEHAFSSLRDSLMGSYLNNINIFRKDSRKYNFGTKPLIYLSNDKSLSDLLVLERYIALGITGRRTGLCEFIPKLDLVLRKPIHVFFTKRLLKNLSLMISSIEEVSPTISISLKGDIEFKGYERLYRIKRLFADGFYDNFEEMLEGIYIGYLVSKERLDHFHHLIKSMEKLIETLEEFKIETKNVDFLYLMPGYVDNTFDPISEFNFFLKLINRDKNSKFLASRWLVYLSTEMMIKEYKLDNDAIISAMNTDEFFLPPYKLATNKSSFLGADERVDFKMIQDLMKIESKKDIYKRDKKEFKSKYNIESDYTIKKNKVCDKEGREIKFNKGRTKTSLSLIKVLQEDFTKEIEENPGNFTLFYMCLKLVGEKTNHFDIDFFDKEQYSGDREISILTKRGRDLLRFVELFMELTAKFIPIELISNPDKFVAQSNMLDDIYKNTIVKGGVVEFWGQDKSRWGPGLMPTYFCDMFYAFKKIIQKTISPIAFKMMLFINHKFHLKRGVIPELIAKSWLKEENIPKISSKIEWNILKKNFLEEGRIKFNIFPGMMEGLMQETSSVYHCSKVVLSNYIIRKYCYNLNYEILIRDGVTSDDSGKAISLSNKNLLSKDIKVKEEEVIKVMKSLFVIEKIDDLINKVFSMLENHKKSFRHTNIFEINQNWIVLNHESSNPFKMYHLVAKHLPGLSWKDNISQAFSIIQAIGKSGASLTTLYYLSKTFKKYINNKYSISKKFFKELKIRQGEVPIEINGYPELCPTDLLLFNIGVNNNRLYKSNIKSKKILTYLSNLRGSDDYENSTENVLEDLTKLKAINFKVRSNKVTQTVRKRILSDFKISFDDIVKEKIENPTSLLFPSYDYNSFKKFVLQKYFGPKTSDMYIKKTDVSNNLLLAAVKKRKICFYKEMKNLKLDSIENKEATEKELKGKEYVIDDEKELIVNKETIEENLEDISTFELYTFEELSRKLLTEALKEDKDLEKKIEQEKEEEKDRIELTTGFKRIETLSARKISEKRRREFEILSRKLSLDNILYNRSYSFYESVTSVDRFKDNTFDSSKLRHLILQYNKIKTTNPLISIIVSMWFPEIVKKNKICLVIKDPDKLKIDFKFLKMRFPFIEDTYEKTVDLNFKELKGNNKTLKYDILKTLIQFDELESTLNISLYLPTKVDNLLQLLETLITKKTSRTYKHKLYLNTTTLALKESLFKYKSTSSLDTISYKVTYIKDLVSSLVLCYELFEEKTKDIDFYRLVKESKVKEEYTGIRKNFTIIKDIIVEAVRDEEVVFNLDKYDACKLLIIYAKLTSDFSVLDTIFEKKREGYHFFVRPNKLVGRGYDLKSDFILLISEENRDLLFSHIEPSLESLTKFGIEFFDRNKKFCPIISTESTSTFFIKRCLLKVKKIFECKLMINEETKEKYEGEDLRCFPFAITKKTVEKLFELSSVSGLVELTKDKLNIVSKPTNENSLYILLNIENVKNLIREEGESTYYQKENTLAVFTKVLREYPKVTRIVEKVVVNPYSFTTKISDLVIIKNDLFTKFGLNLNCFYNINEKARLDRKDYKDIKDDCVVFADFDKISNTLQSRFSNIVTSFKKGFESRKNLVKDIESSFEFKTYKKLEDFLDKKQGLMTLRLKTVSVPSISSAKELYDDVMMSDVLVNNKVPDRSNEYENEMEFGEELEDVKKFSYARVLENKEEELENEEEDEENSLELEVEKKEFTKEDYIKQMEGITLEDLLFSSYIDESSEFAEKAMIPKDFVQKVSFIRKGGITKLASNLILSETAARLRLMLANRDCISLEDVFSLVNILFEESLNFTKTIEARALVKAIYMSKRFFYVPIKKDLKDKVDSILKSLRNIILIYEILTNFKVKGTKKTLDDNFFEIFNCKSYLELFERTEHLIKVEDLETIGE
jgi:hypothetical protein